MKLVNIQQCSEKITFVMTSIYIQSKVKDKVSTLSQHCRHCLRGPNLVRTLLIAACVVMVVQQISVSIEKLIDMPVTTYTHFDFNKTIAYPSVTFCREPSYKFEKLMKYGLFANPRLISTWANFNFSGTTLDKFWEEVTYNEKEYFVSYSLNGLSENLHLTSTLGLISGRCYTLSPKVQVNRATKSSGLSVTLHHMSSDYPTASRFPPGYHVHVHYTREPYTEVEVYNGGLVDYLYVNSGESVDVKLTVDQYIKISDEDDPCTDASNYSTNSCTTKYVWDQVTSKAGCSGPWMETDIPYCTNYADMAELIATYLYVYRNHEYCGCPRICRSYLYNAFVTDRQSFFQWDSLEQQWLMTTTEAPLYTQVHIHFNSMMVSVYEERYNYDWNLFLSDLGGSISLLLHMAEGGGTVPSDGGCASFLATVYEKMQLSKGFLLGLSVIGLMSILTNIWYMIKASIASKKLEKESSSIDSSVVTTDLATISSCKDEKKLPWNINILNY